MYTVCTPELIKLLANNFNCTVTIHRWFNSVKEQIDFGKQCGMIFDWPGCFVSVGNLAKWKDWIDELNLYRNEHVLNFSILVDMANGDTTSCVDTVEYIRKTFDKDVNIMAGNVATRSGYARLQEAGANFIRVGVGGSCFTSDMCVNIKNEIKKISEIKNGDLVYTHTGELKKVIALITYYSEEEIIKINDIKCTKNHEFYVINKEDESLVNENNIHQHAKWVSADKLNKNHLLIELE
jgi:hypothetical protein